MILLYMFLCCSDAIGLASERASDMGNNTSSVYHVTVFILHVVNLSAIFLRDF